MSYEKIEIQETGRYLKVKEGNIVHIHILSKNPKSEKIHWSKKEKLSCVGLNCPMCKNNNVPKQRWKINVWDRKANAVKEFEFGVSIANSIREIAIILKESEMTVHDVDFKIKAQGSGMETRYTVMQVPKSGDVPVQYSEGFTEIKEHQPDGDESYHDEEDGGPL